MFNENLDIKNEDVEDGDFNQKDYDLNWLCLRSSSNDVIEDQAIINLTNQFD